MVGSWFSKKIILVSLVAVFSLPVYTVFVVSPMFMRYLLQSTEEEAVRVARHMSSHLALDSGPLELASVSGDFEGEITRAIGNFKLSKVKVFSASGEVIFSTEAQDLGEINRKPYFLEQVAQGKVFSKVVRGKSETMEGRIMVGDVVETYVPVMKNEKFIGAFEIYYEITDRKGELVRVTLGTGLLSLLIAICLLILILVLVSRTKKSIRQREKAEGDKKLLEDELGKSHKMEAIGTLTSGIAHDFNNIMTAVLVHIDLAKLAAEPGSKVLEAIKEARKASLIANDLIQQLVIISRNEPVALKKVSSAKLIAKSIPVSSREARVRVALSLGDDLWPLEVEEDLFIKALNSVITNADQSMPEAGVVSINVSNQKVSEDNLTVPKGKYVRISIKDKGVGIPAELLGKVFEPYFTTKVKGSQRGTGLGLAFCKSVIDKHHGYIDVESRVGRGTTFHIYMPAVEGQV